VGTGKTFLAECFAKDCGLNVVEFKNFRDKWVGSTEANLEKILNLLQTLAPIVVLIDEADAALGNREADGDSGVNSRVFSKIAAAMGNTENRGRILWILMTSRPDLLPIDLKRQGRCEEHISLFYPEGEEARREIAEAMARKNKIKHQITDWSPVTRSPLHLSGADIESILIRARRVARQAGHSEVLPEDLASVAGEFTPARDELAVEYQELVAAREATSRVMLPQRFQQMASAEISRRIEELRSETVGRINFLIQEGFQALILRTPLSETYDVLCDAITRVRSRFSEQLVRIGANLPGRVVQGSKSGDRISPVPPSIVLNYQSEESFQQPLARPFTNTQSGHPLAESNKGSREILADQFEEQPTFSRRRLDKQGD
jgi:hypothetical protein